MAKSKKDLWYVDFRGAIKGPVLATRIVDELIGGQLKVIHRVSRDKTNWKAICNEPHFEHIVLEQLKKLNAEALKFEEQKTDSSGEQTGFANLTNIRRGISEQLQHAENLQLINLNLSNLRQLHAEIIAKRKIIIEVREKPVDEIHPEDQNEIISDHVPFWKRFDVKDPKQRLRLLVAVAGVALVFLIYSKITENARRKEIAQTQAQAQEALHSKSLGDYDKAIAIFQSVKDAKNLDSQVLLEMADAYLQKQKTLEGSKLVHRALAGHDLSDPDRARAHALLAQVAMQNQDFVGAEKLYEDSIKESTVFPSLHNAAAVEVKLGHNEKAEQLLLKAIQLPYPEKGPTLMLLHEASSLITVEGGAPDRDRLTRLYKLLGDFNEETAFREHLAVERILVANKLGQVDDMQAQINAFIESLGSFRGAQVPLGLDSGYSELDKAYSWCVDLYKDNRSSGIFNAFMSSCTLKAKGAAQALPYAEYALKVAPGVASFRGLVGYLFTKMGDVGQAKRALLDGPRLNTPSNLWTRAAAEICQLQPNTANCNLASDPQYATSARRVPASTPKNRH